MEWETLVGHYGEKVPPFELRLSCINYDLFFINNSLPIS